MDRIAIACALFLGLVFGMGAEAKWHVLDTALTPPARPRACKCTGCDEASCGLPDCDECEADNANA